MKKLILFLMLAVSLSVSLSANAQNNRSATLGFDVWGTESVATFSAVDTATNAAPWAFTIMPNKANGLFYTIAVKITEVSATTSTAIQLQQKKFGYQSWSNLGSAVTYKGTGSDTTALFTEESTKQYWRYLRVLITPANGKVKTTFIYPSFKY